MPLSLTPILFSLIVIIMVSKTDAFELLSDIISHRQCFLYTMRKYSKPKCLATLKKKVQGTKEGGETTGVRSFLIRALLTALPDDIIRASGWLSRQIAAEASLTNTAPLLVNV